LSLRSEEEEASSSSPSTKREGLTTPPQRYEQSYVAMHHIRPKHIYKRDMPWQTDCRSPSSVLMYPNYIYSCRPHDKRRMWRTVFLEIVRDGFVFSFFGVRKRDREREREREREKSRISCILPSNFSSSRSQSLKLFTKSGRGENFESSRCQCDV
jgi:hypothetical protein